MGKRIKKKAIDIPTEIMEEILYKLPVKSLLRFKCVSKSWRSLISSKYFIKHHLKKSSTDGDTDSKDLTFDDSQHIIFQYYKTSFFSLGSCRLPGEPIIKTNSGYYYGTRNSGRSVRIVGSYNGLILITVSSMYNLLLLWNPSTRKAKNILPPASFHEADQLGQTNLYSWGDFRYFLFGFGYDELRDEYKVVCIKVPTWRETSYQTQIYCSNTDSWKKMEVFDKGFPGHRTVFLKGRFHWMAKKGYSDCEIVSLDLVDEKYRIVARPETFIDFHGQKLVELLGGYLSVMCETSDTDTNVWAMMEYGKIESWTKIWTLSDFVSSPFQRFLLTAKLLYLKKIGDITVAFGSNIVVYSGKNEVHKSRVDMLDAKPESIVYVESLVSPFGTCS